MTWTATLVNPRSLVLWLGFALSMLVSAPSHGQIPSQSKKSLLNYLGRFHGIGYSDGYHSCPNDQCGPTRSWFHSANFSSYYGEPTTPPPSRFQRPAPSYAAYQSVAPLLDTPAPGQAPHIYPQHSGVSHPTFPSNSAPPQYYPDPSVMTLGPSLQIHEAPAGRMVAPPPSAFPQSGEINSELLPPPRSSRPADQTRRSIPGSTRPYNAANINPTISPGPIFR